jgi:hypothetical protein
MKELELRYSQLPHPYPSEPGARNEAWCAISFFIVDNEVSEEYLIFETQWDIKPLLQWFRENLPYIINNPFPITITDGNCIAKEIFDFYETADVENEIQINSIFEYRRQHGIRFAMRGVDIPDIYIGIGFDGHEISCWNKESMWRYKIKIDSFESRLNVLASIFL